MSVSNSSRRPRLSLQTKSSPGHNCRTSRTLASVDPKSPTAFNTLSNVYTTAIERSTPVQATPLTAINTQQPLQLQTNNISIKDFQARIQTPYNAHYPETPLSAQPMSPAVAMEITFPSSVMTATPPLSAGPVDSSDTKVFNFSASETLVRRIESAGSQPRRRAPAGAQPPYSHPRTLHSILRNSPLPPSSARTPISPRRQSLRLQEKAAKRVGYNNPLTQTIITNKYTKSHIDLLTEDASPYSPVPAVEDSEMMLDAALAYTGNETRDGGQTPGPFEEMRRRMAGLGTGTPAALSPSGIRKRKRKEKKRRWVWTIGQDEEEDESGAMAAIRAAALAQAEATPTVGTSRIKAASPEPLTAVQISVESPDHSQQEQDRHDVDMSDTSSLTSSSRATTPFSVDSMDLDLDLKTPTSFSSADSKFGRRPLSLAGRLGSVEPLSLETGSRRDTPIPEHLVGN